MNYEEIIKIDETSLDLEWLDQPVKMLQITTAQAEAQRDMEKIQDRLELIKAELDKEIRTDPDKFGITKITEGAIQAAILSMKIYKEINEQLIQARFENNVLKGAVKSFEQRRDALENLVRLHGSQYFAGPKMPRDLHFERENREETQKKVDEGVGMKLKRRK